MSDTTVSVSIKGTDDLSPVFKKVASSAKEAGSALKEVGSSSSSGLDKTGQAAKKAGDSLEDLGKDAAKASKEVEKAGDAAGKAATGFEKVNKSAESAKKNLTALGAAGGLIAGGLAKAGQAAETQRRQVAALEKSYGSAGQAAEQFARELSSSTRFSLEDTQESMRIMATLYNNYGVSLEQIQTLMQQTADLATVTGISLADAAQRTSSAIRGEAESAEFLGLTMNQAAIDRENLTLKMSNQEAAQFRLNAITEQAAFAQGAATESVQTTAGAIDQLTNRMGQAAIAAGDFLGPIGQLAAPMADFAIMLPVAGAALVDLADGMNVGSKAAGALRFAMNPLVIGLTAVVGIAASVVLAHQDAAAAAEEQQIQYENLLDAINQVDDAMARIALRQGIIDPTGFNKQSALDILLNGEAVNEFSESYAKLTEQMAATDPRGAQNWIESYKLLPEQVTQINEAAASGMRVAGEAAEEYGKTLATLKSHHANGLLENDLYTQSVLDIADAMEYAGPGAEKFREIIVGTFDDLLSGDISAEKFAKRIEILTDNQHRYGEMLEANKKSIHDYAQMEQEAAAAAQGSADATKELAFYRGLTTPQTMMTAINEQTIAYNEEQAAIRAVKAEREKNVALYALEQRSRSEDIRLHTQQRDAMLDSIDTTDAYGKRLRMAAEAAYEAEGGVENHKEAMDAANAAMEEHEENAKALADTFRGQLVPGIDGASDAVNALVPPGSDMLDILAEMQEVTPTAGAEFTKLADNINDAAEALDGALTVFSSIDALGQRSAQAAGIAENLVGDPGVWAPIDDMMVSLNDRYNANQISLEQLEAAQAGYNDAVEAGYRIQQNDWSVQNDLQQIRAAQLPWLAEHHEAYAQYVNDLTTASAAEQRHALYLMDTGNQAKLATIESIRHAEALGEIDTEVATDLIVSSAQADPVLAEVLESYGIIEVGANGEITVSWKDGDATTQAVDSLRASVDALNVTLGGTPPKVEIETNAKEVAAEVDELNRRTFQFTDNEGKTHIVYFSQEGAWEVRDAADDVSGAVEGVDGKEGRVKFDQEGAPEVKQAASDVEQGVASVNAITGEVTFTETGADEVKGKADGIKETVDAIPPSARTQFLLETFGADHFYEFEGQLRVIDGKTYQVHVDAATGDVLLDLQEVGTEAEGLAAGEYVIRVGADGTVAAEVIEEYTGDVGTATIQVEYAEPGSGPMSAEDMTGSSSPTLVKVKAYVMEFDTSLVDDWVPPEHTLDVIAELDTSKIGEVSHIKPPTLPVIIDPQVDQAKMDAISTIDLPKVPVIITPKADDAGFAAIGNIDLPKLLVSISPQVDATGFAALKDIEIPKIPVIISPQVDDSGFAAVSNIELPKVPVIISPQVDDAGFAAVSNIQLPKVPVIISPQVDDAGLAQLGNLQIPSIPVNVEIQYATMGEMPTLPELTDIVVNVDIQVNDAAFSSARGAVEEFGRMSATATLEASDGASSKIESARQTAMNFIQTYSAGLAVTDGASGIIQGATASGQAFATTYTGTIAAADQATSIIGTAQGQATAFATTYSATITAVDNASSVIQSVRDQLAALNGTTATTYVNTVSSGGVGPAMMHGGMVKADQPFRIPHAAHGRGVMVGEAGPEMALLPYGTLVQPHGASMARKESSGAGTEMADAFTAEILSGQDKAEDAGEKLAEAASKGMQQGASKYGSGNSVELTDFKFKNIKGPQNPPKELPKNATPKQEKRHERQTAKYEEQLDNAIDRATDQWQEAPDPASRKKAMEVLARLLRTQDQLEAAEARREAAAERAAKKEEEAAKKKEEAQRKAAEAASKTATATEGIADGAGVASGAIEKLNATMSSLNGTSEQTLNTTSTGLQEVSNEAQQVAADMESINAAFPSDAHGEIEEFGSKLAAVTEGDHATELQAIGQELQEIGSSAGEIDTSRLRELSAELDALAASGAGENAAQIADSLIRWADGIDNAKSSGLGDMAGEFDNVSRALLGASSGMDALGMSGNSAAAELKALLESAREADAVLAGIGDNASMSDVAADINHLADALENMNGAAGVSDLVLDITSGLREVAAAAEDGSIDIETLSRTLEGLGTEISNIDGGYSAIPYFNKLGEAANDLAADMKKLPASMKPTEKAMGSLVKDTNQASNALTRLDNRDIMPSIDVNTEPFDKGMKSIMDDGKELEKTTFIPDADINRATWDRVYADITKKLDTVDRDSVSPEVKADKSKFDSTMTTIKNTSYTATVKVTYKDTDGNVVAPSKLSGVSQTVTPKLHGGQIRAARHGRAIMAADMIPHAQHGRNILVGEAGPEIVNLPIGSMVHTNPASRSRMEMGGQESYHFHGPVYFTVKDNDAMDAVRRYVRNGGG